jgi:hypothetical protein
MWALGVVIFCIKYQRYPTLEDYDTLINTDPLLKGLLDPIRETRIDAKTALSLHKEKMQAPAAQAEEAAAIRVSPVISGTKPKTEGTITTPMSTPKGPSTR